MRRLSLLAVVLVAVFAGSAAARTADRPPPQFPALPGTWSHIQENVKIRGVWHTLILDRGRIVQAAAKQLTLLEADGTTQSIPLDAKTIVSPPKLGLTVLDLRRGWAVDAMRIDGGSAVRIRVRVSAIRRLRVAP